jgi:hypothetical protein
MFQFQTSGLSVFKLSLFAMAAVFTLHSSPAEADHVENQNFLQAVESIAAANDDVAVEAVFDRAKAFSVLSDRQIAGLTQIASEQAQIWGDTILEGDYEADGKTELDHVDALSLDGRLIAYRLVYSERSWETSVCTFPANRDSSALSRCQEGRIHEASFASPDLSSWTRDPDAFATFD